MNKVSARKLLETVQNFPDHMLSSSMKSLEKEAQEETSRQKKLVWGFILSVLLAVCLPILDLNTGQTFSRQLISPLAALIISVWVFFQINLPIKAQVRLDFLEASEFETLVMFLDLRYRPYRLGDRDEAEACCVKILQTLANRVRILEEAVSRTPRFSEALENDLDEARELFGDHLVVWRMLGLHNKKRKFFFPSEVNPATESESPSSTGFRH